MKATIALAILVGLATATPMPKSYGAEAVQVAEKRDGTTKQDSDLWFKAKRDGTTKQDSDLWFKRD
ncbi:hypothetical protein QBC43DRAFT_294740 [Cladorrhinum sp. PSN259]|nr:hypothetical protein QBC43DRAFT_294740 [Cladorrhinum sp. PSN259]